VARAGTGDSEFGTSEPYSMQAAGSSDRWRRRRQRKNRPAEPCGGPRMNPSLDVGNPPRPFRHLRMTERRTPDRISSRAPVHSVLVQKSVTTITNAAGRLSRWMLGKPAKFRKPRPVKSWHFTCQSVGPAAKESPVHAKK